MKQVELASHTALGKTPCASTVVIVYRRVDWLRWYSTHLLVWGSLSDAGRMSQGAGIYRGLTVSKNKLMFLDDHFLRCAYVENTHTEYSSLTEKNTQVSGDPKPEHFTITSNRTAPMLRLLLRQLSAHKQSVFQPLKACMIIIII